MKFITSVVAALLVMQGVVLANDRRDERRRERDDVYERIESVSMVGEAEWRTPTETILNVDLLQARSISIQTMDPSVLMIYRVEAIFNDGKRLLARDLRGNLSHNATAVEVIPVDSNRKLVQIFVKAAYIEGYNRGRYLVTVEHIKVEKRPLPFTDTFARGEVDLRQGEQIVVRDYNLILQNDGNLVLYNRHNGRPLWATNTLNGERAVFQEDGNFVLYGRYGRVLWMSRTDRLGAQLTLSEYGYLMIEDYRGNTLWVSNRADRY